MKYLAQTVHDKYDLKFGLYTAQHEYTCQKRPGSYKHETLDAATMCDWEVDYLKVGLPGIVEVCSYLTAALPYRSTCAVVPAGII